MEENKNIQPEQPLQNNTEEINSTTENILPEAETAATEEPQTSNLKTETSNMEVHHHTHPGHHKKNWKDYFWEFLMLFLAVFCGFLAEYQLEHKIEKEREKQYSQTLHEDLKADTAILNALIRENDFVIPKIDSFRLLVHTKAIGDISSGTWYYYGRFGTRNLTLSLQNVTLQQLVSSGGLRYFKKQNVVYDIAAYDQVLRDIKNTLDLQLWTYNEVIKARNQIFDSWFMDEIMDFSGTSSKVDSFKQKSFPLLSNKREDFLNYANYCQMRSFNKKGERESLVQALKGAEKLMALLKKEYHLENE